MEMFAVRETCRDFLSRTALIETSGEIVDHVHIRSLKDV